MKTFYLLRHEDVHDNTGIGVVAEGIIFDSGMAAMTWRTKFSTVTVFDNIATVKAVHGHGGRTEVVIEEQDERFEECKAQARAEKTEKKKKEKVKEKEKKVTASRKRHGRKKRT